MQDIQQVYFDIVSKEEAHKLFAEGHEELYLLHEDLSESLTENADEITDAQEPIGKHCDPAELNDRQHNAMDEVYKLLEGVRNCMNDEDPEVGEHYDCKQDLDDAMKAINYLNGFGYGY